MSNKDTSYTTYIYEYRTINRLNMTTVYLFDKSNRTDTMSRQRQAVAIIQAFFAKYQSLVGKPLFTVSPNKVIVQVFYYAPTESISNTAITALGDAMTRC